MYTITNKEKEVLGWAGTIADARAEKKALDGKNWEEVNIPTSKPEFLAFLKNNVKGQVKF